MAPRQHRDALGSVRAITTLAGARIEGAVYRPFGAQSEWLSSGQPAPETKGWIGERFDADAGLQYLNARYYDPLLGMFLQPDWFEVTKAGVGTNRYSYSFNDPVNKLDPGRNGGLKELTKKVFGGLSHPAGEAALRVGMNKLRNEAIKAAWRQEQALVKAGGGTRRWTAAEKEEPLSEGSVAGYDGHRINNVAGHPELAGLANNITFMKTDSHKNLHRDNGGYRMPTSGEMIDRNVLFRDLTGKDLPSGTRERLTYEDVVKGVVSVADTVLNSRTMMVIDMMDPSTWADQYMRQNYGVDLFGGSVEWSDDFLRECIAAGRCS